ncbi:MAG: Gfo/Idh/MocA family oxidoreductase [Planctomycetota bacterium]
MKITRRKALAAMASTPLVMPHTVATARRVLGSNEDLRIAVVGVRGRGQDHVGGFEKVKGARVVALCDVDSEVLASRAADFEKKQQRKLTTFADVRRLLEEKDIDAVSIATPNHWHTLIAIWAMQAGKDVYVEKPVSHDLREGEALVRAAQKTGRIVQCGTQCRSSVGLQTAVAFVREGGLGRIRVVRGLCYKPRPSIGKVDGPQPVPASVDYELWCGPAAKDPLTRRNLHYDWHWVWSTGNGDLGNQGIHQMDIARWILGEGALPAASYSFGGRVGYVDDGQTPNTMVTVHEYSSAPMLFEVRGLPRARGAKDMDRYLGASIGVVVHGERGWMTIPSYSDAYVYAPDGAKVGEFKGGGDHFANFVEAVAARDASKLNGPIVEGHLSSALCHLGNISLRMGAPSEPKAIAEAVAADVAGAEAQARLREHLAANEVDLGITPLAMGARLSLDPVTARFVGPLAERAEQFASGTHRAPFELPEV